MMTVKYGYEMITVGDLEEEINQYVHKMKFNLISVPLVHPRNIRNERQFEQKFAAQCFTRSDMVLKSSNWRRYVIGKITPSIEVDSEIVHISKKSELILTQEVTLAGHLGIRAVIVPLKSIHCFKLAKTLNSLVKTNSNFDVLMKLPATDIRLNIHKSVNQSVESDSDPWDWWNTFRLQCGFSRHFKIALEFPSFIPTEEQINRWLGEPVSCVVLPTTAFLINQHGYPVLPRRMQTIIRQFIVLDVAILVTGSPLEGKDLSLYKNYLENHIVAQGTLTPQFKGYEDVLQIPLQPLADNLESEIYEVFELDPVKYKCYQDAICAALEDRVPADKRDTTKQTIMIVGAGRGPFVQAALNAGSLLGIELDVLAIEKNSMAVNTLCALNKELWDGKVRIIETDMRLFTPHEKADILVSELLGSFGDNELSPECLDGAQHLLKSDGISIPCSYSTWLAPLHSPKLIQDIRLLHSAEKTLQYCFETMYVVQLVNKYQIAPAQKCWTFNHPNITNQSNERSVTLRFQSEQNCLLTGFAGYFDVVLYKDFVLSTEPRSYTDKMSSWFPAYFPIQNHIPIKADENIEVKMWRCVNNRFVWYEWVVTQPQTTHLHNVRGQSYKITM